MKQEREAGPKLAAIKLGGKLEAVRLSEAAIQILDLWSDCYLGRPSFSGHHADTHDPASPYMIRTYSRTRDGPVPSPRWVQPILPLICRMALNMYALELSVIVFGQPIEEFQGCSNSNIRFQVSVAGSCIRSVMPISSDIAQT